MKRNVICHEASVWRPPPRRSLIALALAVSAAMSTHAAEWKLVDEGACEGPIVGLSMGLEPELAYCTAKTAGLAALCYSEVCQPHCLYFDHPVERCPPGADLGKRYACAPD